MDLKLWSQFNDKIVLNYLTQVIAYNDEGMCGVEGNVVELALFPRYDLLDTDSLEQTNLIGSNNSFSICQGVNVNTKQWEFRHDNSIDS